VSDKPRFKVAYVPWWRPIRLAMRQGEGSVGWEFIGWLWRQKAYMVNNHYHGWIAFVEDQTPEKLVVCASCKRPIASEDKA